MAQQIVDLNEYERRLEARPEDTLPGFMRHNQGEAGQQDDYRPPAARQRAEVPTSMPTMSDAAKRHTTDLDRRVAAWLEQRVAMSEEIREGIETADNMKRIYLALQAELDSAHMQPPPQPAEPEAPGSEADA